MPIPLTRTRLATSLSLIATHQTNDNGTPFDFSDALRGAFNLAEFSASLKFIGATNVFRVNQTASNYKRRGINSPREPFAVVPGPIETTIEIERATLYYEDAMAGFKFTPGNIAYQTRPLIIIENVTAPTTEQRNGDPTQADFASFLKMAAKSITAGVTGQNSSPLIYLNCVIRDSRIAYDLKGSDQAVMQSVVLDVGRIEQPTSLVPVVGEPLTQVLAQTTGLRGLVTGS